MRNKSRNGCGVESKRIVQKKTIERHCNFFFVNKHNCDIKFP